MCLLVVRLDYEEQMFPNWHFCCPGVHITANSFFAFRVDIESETPPLGFTALNYIMVLAAHIPITHLELLFSVQRQPR